MTNLISSRQLIEALVTLPSMRVKDRTDFGERLLKARLHAKLSQGELGKRSGLGQSAIAYLESKAHGSTKVAALAEITGVRSAWLADSKGPMLELDEPLAQFAEKAEQQLVPSSAKDFRTLAHTVADALEQTGTEVSVRQFLTLVDKLSGH